MLHKKLYIRYLDPGSYADSTCVLGYVRYHYTLVIGVTPIVLNL